MMTVDMLLEDFAGLLEEKTTSLKRIPYDKWRELKSIGGEDLDVTEIEQGTYLINGMGPFSNYDHSLGEFIWAYYPDYIKPNNLATANQALGNFSITTMGIRNSLDKMIKEFEQQMKEKDETDMSKNIFGNFEFGSCEGNKIRISPYGLAVQNSGSWVSYDSKSGNIIDVDVFNFDGAKFLYKIPVAINAVKAGDVVIHAKKPMFVLGVEDGGLVVVDPVAGEEKKILPTRSPFNFNFITKVVNLFDNCGLAGSATADSPFGNFLPFMLMGDDNDSNLLPLMLLSGKTDFTSNPMLMYALMSGDKNKDLLPLFFLTNGLAENK